jgi:hypothetical protein
VAGVNPALFILVFARTLSKVHTAGEIFFLVLL